MDSKPDAAKKDFWQRVSVIGAIATPLLVVALGWVLNQSLARRDAAFERSLEQMRDERRAAGQRIQQSELLVTLMPTLTGTDSQQKQLAIKIALHALGETGREIVEFISESDPVEANRNYATSQLNDRRAALIRQLIAPEHPTRWNAAEELGTSWANDPQLVPDLLAFAEANRGNDLAVYNVTTVLADLPASVLVEHMSRLAPFLERAERIGPKTASKVEEVRTLARIP